MVYCACVIYVLVVLVLSKQADSGGISTCSPFVPTEDAHHGCSSSMIECVVFLAMLSTLELAIARGQHSRYALLASSRAAALGILVELLLMLALILTTSAPPKVRAYIVVP